MNQSFSTMIPIYSYPTTILFLDNNIDYLNNLRLRLPSNHFSFRLYNNHKKALDYILTNHHTTNDPKDYWRSANPVHLDSFVVELDIPSLYHKCYNPDRFQALSTVVVDYDIHNIDGLDFLKKIQFPGIHRILLTDEANVHIAIDAFNAGLINQYLKKQDPNLETLLINTFLKSQIAYFNYLSFAVIDVLNHQENYYCALLEPEFEKFFYETLMSYNIIEYYLLDTIGSYLMITDTNEIIILHTQNEDQAKSYYLEIKDLGPEYFTDEEKDSIKNRDKIFCYRSFYEERFPDPSLWKQYYRNAHKIQGNNKFYCSIEKCTMGIDFKKIIPFTLYTKDRRSIFD